MRNSCSTCSRNCAFVGQPQSNRSYLLNLTSITTSFRGFGLQISVNFCTTIFIAGIISLLLHPTFALPEVPCDSIDIRNDPINNRDKFKTLFQETLANCTVIEGSVFFVLMTNANLTQEDFQHFHLPNVREITGFVLVFQVEGLRTLSHVFPNLRVIRGDSVIHNYALVIYQTGLSQIGLHNLAVVKNGGVRISDNKFLCNADTINWKDIMLADQYLAAVDMNQDPNICTNTCNQSGSQCETRENDKREHVPSCWDADHCQIKYRCSNCPGGYCNATLGNGTLACCHEECLGGCVGTTDKDCYACKHVIHDGTCMQSCPVGFFKYHDRRCLSEAQCQALPYKQDEFGQARYYKALAGPRGSSGICSLECQEGYEEPEYNKTICVKCAGHCKKRCHGQTILSLSEAQKLQGCHIINGVLEFRVRSGPNQKNIVQKMEEYLSKIEEVTHYVRISFSPSFLTLNVLKNLRVIRGEQLWHNKYALTVFENEHLTNIWPGLDPNVKKLEILRGGIQFQNNPKLCPAIIDGFLEKTVVMNATAERDVNRYSNGNEVVCEEIDIPFDAAVVMSTEVVFRWEEFNTTDMDDRSFLGYKLFYKEVESENISINDHRDACADTWQFVFVAPTERGGIIIDLKPYTLYATYLVTLMINSPGAKGGISKLVFVRTLFGPPSAAIIKQIEARSPNQIWLSWDSPEKPNGVITHYIVSYIPRIDVLPPGRDYCKDPPQFQTDKSFGDVRTALGGHDRLLGANVTLAQSGGGTSKVDTCPAVGCCDCNKLARQQNRTAMIEPDKEAIEQRQEKNEFENLLHNVVFIAKNCNDEDEDAKPPGLCANAQEQNTSVAASETSDSELKRHKRAIESSATLPDMNQSTSSVPGLKGTDEFLLATMGPAFANATSTISPETMLAPRVIPKLISVNVTDTKIMLSNLTHFTPYEIKIKACQNTSEDTFFCSELDAAVQKRTKSIPEKDAIDAKTVRIHNDTKSPNSRTIFFDLPTDPNGLIVSVNLIVQHADGHPAKICVPASTWFSTVVQRVPRTVNYTLDRLMTPGNYTLRIQAVSLAKEGPLSAPVTFVIQGPFALSISVIAGIAVVCCVTIVGLIVFIGIFLYKRNIKRTQQKILMDVMTNPDYITQTDFYKADEWELNREDIQLKKDIGEGTFGKVHYGIGNNITSQCGVTFGECAVKTIRGNCGIYEVCHFLREASFMKLFQTTHIVKLYGVVSNGQPALVVMEYMHKGNLKDYLRARRPDAEENVDNLPPPTLQEIYQWSGQIADGMAYLEQIKFCHRDLAARNCLVGADSVCKIGDFGMARDVYVKEYYRPDGKRLMPVRWMAPEALQDAKFTHNSDVWSYGVVLWEMVTLATQPYQGLNNEEVMNFVYGGNVMSQPKDCPDLLYRLMRQCWQFNPRDRPSFFDILDVLLPKMNEIYIRDSFYTNGGREKRGHHDGPTNLALALADVRDHSYSSTRTTSNSSPHHHNPFSSKERHGLLRYPQLSSHSSSNKSDSATTAVIGSSVSGDNGTEHLIGGGGTLPPPSQTSNAVNSLRHAAAASSLLSTNNNNNAIANNNSGASHADPSSELMELMDFSVAGPSANGPDNGDATDPETPLNPCEAEEDKTELIEGPLCSNNRRGGMIKSVSTPNYQKAASRVAKSSGAGPGPMSPDLLDRRSSHLANGSSFLNGHVTFAT